MATDPTLVRAAPATRLPAASGAGALLRDWRERRRLSQLQLAAQAGISTRHLSFVETGRSRPSRGMLLHLSEALQLPLRERNALMTAAGFAPAYAEHALDAPELAAARAAVELVLAGHEPYPAIAVDRHWNLLLGNRAAHRLLAGLAAELLAPPVNVLRLTLHPHGLGARIGNLAALRTHLLARLRAQAAATGDAALAALYDELAGYPAPPDGDADLLGTPHADVVVPLELDTPHGPLRLFSTITVFGTPTDVTLSELAVEAFFPAEAATAARLHAMASADAAG